MSPGEFLNLAVAKLKADILSDTSCRIANKAIVFVSAFQFEGGDRADLQLGRNGSGLINEVASYCSDTIVVIHSCVLSSYSHY